MTIPTSPTEDLLLAIQLLFPAHAPAQLADEILEILIAAGANGNRAIARCEPQLAGTADIIRKAMVAHEATKLRGRVEPGVAPRQGRVV